MLKQLSAQSTVQNIVLALALAILAKILLGGYPWGINFSMVLLALVAVLVALEKKFSYLSLALILLAFLYMWRTSYELRFLNFLAITFLLFLQMSRLQSWSVLRFDSILFNSSRTAVLFGFAPIISLLHTEWKQGLEGPKPQLPPNFFISLFRGLMISLPLFIIFAALFSSADEIFALRLRSFFGFDLDLESLIENFIQVCLLWYMFGAILSLSSQGNLWSDTRLYAPKFSRLGVIELVIVLGSLIALFAGFMFVQLQYLFPAKEHIELGELTYAYYGRNGFFELCLVTLLLHLVLFFIHWLTHEEQALSQKVFRILAFALSLLQVGVVVSAFKRLQLYIAAYGLTEDRFYGMAGIIFISVVMLVFLTKLVFRAGPSLASSYFALYLLWLIGLTAINPDAFISRYNVRLYIEGTITDYDPSYVGSLSIDNLPTLLNLQQAHPELSRLGKVIEKQGSKLRAASDWRQQSIASWQAGRALARIQALDLGD